MKLEFSVTNLSVPTQLVSVDKLDIKLEYAPEEFTALLEQYPQLTAALITLASKL